MIASIKKTYVFDTQQKPPFCFQMFATATEIHVLLQLSSITVHEIHSNKPNKKYSKIYLGLSKQCICEISIPTYLLKLGILLGHIFAHFLISGWLLFLSNVLFFILLLMLKLSETYKLIPSLSSYTQRHLFLEG